jgi:hypothetical protein
MWLFAKLLLCFCVYSLFSCNENKANRNIEPAFYYWKSVFNLSGYEQQKLDSLKVKTLYIKFFDVGWNDVAETSVPVAKLQPGNFKLPPKFTVVPAVFITNECIQKIHSSQIAALSGNIYTLVDEIIKRNSFKPIKEIQIDCDWTAGTKSNYFLLLEKLSSLYKDSGIAISATIRLHQIKFAGKTGVPPVNKGLLMCYNMGNLKNPATNNSIIETEELEKYTAALSSYPLPLDVALPLFDWKVLFRNNAYNGLVQNLSTPLLSTDVALQNNNRFTILKDTVLAGYDLKKGDVLRNEQSSYKEVMNAAASISRQLKNTSLTVSLYHLDSVILNKYSLHELETVYNSLR